MTRHQLLFQELYFFKIQDDGITISDLIVSPDSLELETAGKWGDQLQFCRTEDVPVDSGRHRQ